MSDNRSVFEPAHRRQESGTFFDPYFQPRPTGTERPGSLFFRPHFQATPDGAGSNRNAAGARRPSGAWR
ncbi:hypothetical protein AEGHOMDF_1773 [Methylobacterium soli]|nr:hypothetical protein AEGHOMDF_1773 [Methylobacterium soli]